MSEIVQTPGEPRTTALERALDGDGAEPRRTPLDALRLARQKWLADQRIDMGVLAAELGASRATLYNWVGSKERLIGEIVWAFSEPIVNQARESAPGSGAADVAEVPERAAAAAATF